MALTNAEKRRRYRARHPERCRATDRKYNATASGRATRRARNIRRVKVHDGPGGTVYMPTPELALVGRAEARKIKAAHAAEANG